MGKTFCKVENKWCKFLKRGTCTYCNSSLGEVSRCPRVAEIETTRLLDILKTVSFDDVFSALCKWFPNQGQEDCFEDYKKVMDILLSKKPKKHNLDDMFITIDKVIEDGREYLDVLGLDHIRNKKYAIEFVPWADWISMYITQETLDTLSNEEIAAGCLYEMTFNGFSEEDITDKKNRMINSLIEIKNER